MDARLLSKSGTSIRTPSDTDASVVVMLSGDARPARMAVMGVTLERCAAPRAVAGGGRETAAALRAEGGVRFGARAVGGARGRRERGAGSGTLQEGTAPRSPLPGIGAQGSQCFRGVLGLQKIVVCIGELTGRAIELDLLQRPQRNGARTQVVVGVLPLTHVARFLIPVFRHLRSKDRSEDEAHRSCGEQDPRNQLEHGG